MQAIEKGISALNQLFHRKPKKPEKISLCDSINTRAGYIPDAVYQQPIQNHPQQRLNPIPSDFDQSFENLGWGPSGKARFDMPPIIGDIHQTQIQLQDQSQEPQPSQITKDHKVLEFPAPETT